MTDTLARWLVLTGCVGLCQPSVLSANEFSPNILIELFTADQTPVTGRTPVSGTLTGRVTVTRSLGQHAQFYKNFRIITADAPGRMVDSDPWVRTFTLESSEFYDGENLISVHVHPANAPGAPYIADFSVQAVTIVTANGNPAPNGDVTLPTIAIDPTMMALPRTTLMDSRAFSTDHDAVAVYDEGRRIDVDQREHESSQAQVIPHLGTSILGRFRWTDRSLPFGDSVGRLIRRAHLVNFQRTTDTPARIVFFFNDACGRANYGFHRFTLPALSAAARRAYPLPSTNARILNVADGDEIVIPDDGAFTLTVEVTNPRRLGPEFATLSTWVGNRSVAATDLAPLIRAMTDDDTSLIVDVEIPAAEIRKLQESRQGGVDATAFALWNDFDRFRDSSLPASGHIHVSSIRTRSYPWPVERSAPP